METQDLKAEIAVLEIDLAHYEMLLDKSLESNEEFSKTRIIFQEIKRTRDRLEEIKKNGNRE